MSSNDQTPENEEEFTLTLDDVKMWLFRESIRQMEEREKIEHEREKMVEEMEAQVRRMESRKSMAEVQERQIAMKERLVDEKLAILQQEYLRLEKERKKLEADREQFEEEKKTYETIRRFTRPVRQVQNITYIGADILFEGVTNEAQLKKRYRDLLKIFHPDNLGGDSAIIQGINKEYDNLRQKYS